MVNQIEQQRYFTPDRKLALIVGNFEYDKLTEWDGLETVGQDMINVINGLQRFGFQANDIHPVENVNYA